MQEHCHEGTGIFSASTNRAVCFSLPLADVPSLQDIALSWQSGYKVKIHGERHLTIKKKLTSPSYLTELAVPFGSGWHFWDTLCRLGFWFDIIAVNPCLVTCNYVFYTVIIVCRVKKFLTELKTLLFLLISQQTWYKFSCNLLHTQIIYQNLMTWAFGNANFNDYLPHCQMSILTDDFMNFSNMLVIFW